MQKRYMLPMVIGALYTLSPIDAIPDFIPVAGQADDAGVIIAMLAVMGLAWIISQFMDGQHSGHGHGRYTEPGYYPPPALPTERIEYTNASGQREYAYVHVESRGKIR